MRFKLPGQSKFFTLFVLLAAVAVFFAVPEVRADVSVEQFAAEFGRVDCSDSTPCQADMDDDGDVDGLDLALLINGEYAANVWITPSPIQIGGNQNFDISIMIDTNNKNLGGFDIYLDFDASKVTIDTSQGEDPASDSGQGFHRGSDAGNYSVLSNGSDVANGHFRLVGACAGPYVNGGGEQLVIIHCKTTNAFTSGTTTLSLRVNDLADELARPLATGSVTGADIVFSP